MSSHSITNHLPILHQRPSSIPDAVSHLIYVCNPIKNHSPSSFLFDDEACLLLVWLSVQSLPKQFLVLFLYYTILIGHFLLFRFGSPLFSFGISVTVDQLQHIRAFLPIGFDHIQ
jgi:hypothetical protein